MTNEAFKAKFAKFLFRCEIEYSSDGPGSLRGLGNFDPGLAPLIDNHFDACRSFMDGLKSRGIEPTPVFFFRTPLQTKQDFLNWSLDMASRPDMAHSKAYDEMYEHLKKTDKALLGLHVEYVRTLVDIQMYVRSRVEHRSP